MTGSGNSIALGNLNCQNPEPTPEISAIKIDPQNIYLQCESNVVYVDVSTVSGDAIEDIGDSRVVLESAGNIFGFSNGTFDQISKGLSLISPASRTTTTVNSKLMPIWQGTLILKTPTI
ncbi:hypothetical protein JCM19238_999 [Vibrio ponticus]|nr:hypothetical protein JCM19238_999 [Vibrio ponticus]